MPVQYSVSSGGGGWTERVAGRTQTHVDAISAGHVLCGILAQRTNSGRFVQDKFAVIPELGVTLGYQMTDQWKATFGYTFIYWSSVARPGVQIDPVVNPNLFPPEPMMFTGALRPQFAFRDTDIWLHGINLGLEYTW